MDHENSNESCARRYLAAQHVDRAKPTPSDRRPGKSSFLLVTDNENNNPSNISQRCKVCDAEHKLADCPVFQRMNLEDRLTQIRKHRLCFSCYKDNHRSYSDHRQTASAPNPTPGTNSRNGAPINLTRQLNPRSDNNLLLRIVPVKLFGKNGMIKTFALFDEGAKLTLIDESLAEQLEPSNGEKHQSLHLLWYGDQTTTEPSRSVCLQICGIRANSNKYDIFNARTVRDLRLPKQTVNIQDLDSRYQIIKHLPIDEFTNAVPQILIGVDHPNLGVPQEVSECNDRELIAAKTRLGWVVYGREMRNFTGIIQCNKTAVPDENQDLHAIVAEFHTTDSFGVKICKPIELNADSRARRLLQETTIRGENRFETGLLWSTDDVKLPKSRQMAVKRLVSTENKMRKDLKYAEMYEKFITDYLSKGYARKLSPAEAACDSPRTWYLPYFGVVNINKPNKLRLVFDAAAPLNGTSLNSMLLTGPDEHNPLPKVLFQFRVGTVGVSGDIAEMFHQNAIRREDQNSKRFLWRHGDTSKPIDTFVMQVMTFGARCSPCSAQYVMRENAIDFIKDHPQAVAAIQENHYVDDFVMSFNSSNEATETTKTVVKIHSRGVFQLRNFRSNCRQVLDALGLGETSRLSRNGRG